MHRASNFDKAFYVEKLNLKKNLCKSQFYADNIISLNSSE